MKTIKHKFLYCIHKNDIKNEALHKDPVVKDKRVFYSFVSVGEEFKNYNNERTMSFSEPNFTYFEFYVCDDDNELNDNIEMIKLKIGV
jgi:hypothetical protein